MSKPQPIAARASAPSLQEMQRIVELARTAPSGDNIQPFDLQWDGRVLRVYHNNQRAAHALNPKNIASLLTFGCHLECITLSAAAFGWATSIVRKPYDDSDRGLWAEISFSPTTAAPDRIAHWLDKRHVDRRPYQGGDLKELVFRTLEGESKKFPTLGFHLSDDLSTELLNYLVRCEAYTWSRKQIQQDIIRWVRFDQKENATWPDGMPWQSLGVHYLESRVLKLARHWWVQRALNALGFLRILQLNLRRKFRASAGCCLITVKSADLENVVEGGRLGLRMWVALNQAGYGVQPLSLASLSSFFMKIGAWDEESLFRDGETLLRGHFNVPADETPLWLFRTGKSTPLAPYQRSGRRPTKIFLKMGDL